MNKEAMYKVADAIEKHNEIELNMDVIAGVKVDEDKNVCGTIGCVAGFTLFALDRKRWDKAVDNTNVVHHRDAKRYHTNASVIDPACELLGINREKGEKLFIYTSVNYDDITNNRDKIPTILRWMADNNCPRWPEAVRALNLQHLIRIHD